MSRRTQLTVAVLLVCAFTAMSAHDLFLKPADFFVKPGATIRVRVLNGTFTASEGPVARGRLRDLHVLGADAPAADRKTWDTTSKGGTWTVKTGAAGTYVLGASTIPRTIRLSGKDFNSYLTEDGLPDALADRKRLGELEKPAHERYSKHVKTLVQVGEARAGAIDSVLGYPAELVPLDNPYALTTGKTLRVRALLGGTPVANQFVLAGGHTAGGKRIAETGVRTDKDGVARITLRQRGVWYVKFINMARIDPAARDSVDYESKWATLTFAVR